MENETNINLIENKESEDIFKLDYYEQNYNTNAEFRRWRNSMMIKFGRNSRLFKCMDDEILFCSTNEDCKNFPFYQSKCPLCKNHICFFCHRSSTDSFGPGTCCLRRRFYCTFFQIGFDLINPIDREHYYGHDFHKALIFYFIPGINLLFFIAEMHVSLFYKLGLKNYKPKKYNKYIKDYELRYKKNYKTLQILVGIDIAFSIALTFSYILLNLYFIIILTIISLPFKLYPMKYYISIAYRNII